MLQPCGIECGYYLCSMDRPVPWSLSRPQMWRLQPLLRSRLHQVNLAVSDRSFDILGLPECVLSLSRNGCQPTSQCLMKLQFSGHFDFRIVQDFPCYASRLVWPDRITQVRESEQLCLP